MKQTRRLSLIEAITNLITGFVLAVLVQRLVFPMYGFEATVQQNVELQIIFTLVGFVRSYCVRRFFTRLK